MGNTCSSEQRQRAGSRTPSPARSVTTSSHHRNAHSVNRSFEEGVGNNSSFDVGQPHQQQQQQQQQLRNSSRAHRLATFNPLLPNSVSLNDRELVMTGGGGGSRRVPQPFHRPSGNTTTTTTTVTARSGGNPPLPNGANTMMMMNGKAVPPPPLGNSLSLVPRSEVVSGGVLPTSGSQQLSSQRPTHGPSSSFSRDLSAFEPQHGVPHFPSELDVVGCGAAGSVNPHPGGGGSVQCWPAPQRDAFGDYGSTLLTSGSNHHQLKQQMSSPFPDAAASLKRPQAPPSHSPLQLPHPPPSSAPPPPLAPPPGSKLTSPCHPYPQHGLLIRASSNHRLTSVKAEPSADTTTTTLLVHGAGGPHTAGSSELVSVNDATPPDFSFPTVTMMHPRGGLDTRAMFIPEPGIPTSRAPRSNSAKAHSRNTSHSHTKTNSTTNGNTTMLRSSISVDEGPGSSARQLHLQALGTAASGDVSGVSRDWSISNSQRRPFRGTMVSLDDPAERSMSFSSTAPTKLFPHDLPVELLTGPTRQRLDAWFSGLPQQLLQHPRDNHSGSSSMPSTTSSAAALPLELSDPTAAPIYVPLERQVSSRQLEIALMHSAAV